MRTLATFQSDAFNTSNRLEQFINTSCFGEDLARWLSGRLRARGLATDAEPGQEDFGWYFSFDVPAGRHCLVVGFRPEDRREDSVWIAWLERSRGLLGSLLGRRRSIAMDAVEAIHRALTDAPEIRNVRWHRRKDFDAGRDDCGTADPRAA